MANIMKKQQREPSPAAKPIDVAYDLINIKPVIEQHDEYSDDDMPFMKKQVRKPVLSTQNTNVAKPPV